MDGQEFAAVVQTGEQLSAVKLTMTAVQCLWIYDYLLTVGDEINYAWSAGRTRIFALFIANRYAPVLHLIWVHITMFHYNKPFCRTTKWMPIFHSTTVVVLAQMVIALRVYVVTGRNNFIGGLLALVVVAQLCHGIFSAFWIGLRPLQPLPEVNLDAFKFCIYGRWRPGELIYYHLTIAFDIVALLIILVTAKRSRVNRHPNIPSLLDTIARDATHYFVFIFLVQFVAVLFNHLAPEGIQLIPGIANTIFVPVMASRLMLSLKKAAAHTEKLWSLETLTTIRMARSTGNGIQFAQVPSGLREVSKTSTALNEEDIELDAAPRNRVSHHV